MHTDDMALHRASSHQDHMAALQKRLWVSIASLPGEASQGQLTLIFVGPSPLAWRHVQAPGYPHRQRRRWCGALQVGEVPFVVVLCSTATATDALRRDPGLAREGPAGSPRAGQGRLRRCASDCAALARPSDRAPARSSLETPHPNPYTDFFKVRLAAVFPAGAWLRVAPAPYSANGC